MPIFSNVHTAIYSIGPRLVNKGELVPSRGGRTREILHYRVTLERPWQRFIFQPHRNQSPAALVAETLWVLAGRNDIGWLSRYLPRAADFSDDGATWRAAYGPRLRGWPAPYQGIQVDQLAQVLNELRSDPLSRRAVIGLWDPARDWPYSGSKDFPCNNWLHFLVRDNKLHLSVAIRSNDLWWGWSGINTFEWSVLLEAMAYWLGLPMGTMTTFSDSLHVYERHWERVRRLGKDGWPGLPPVYREWEQQRDPFHRDCRFETPFGQFDMTLNELFNLEERLHASEPLPGTLRLVEEIREPFFRSCMMVLAAHSLWEHGAAVDEVEHFLSHFPMTDFRLATKEWIHRQAAIAAASHAPAAVVSPAAPEEHENVERTV